MQLTTSDRPLGATPTPFTTYDGHTLAMFDWSVPSHTPTRGVVVICHGLGEHAWRHDRLATALAAAGYAVRAYDQRGHGESAGKRGQLPTADALLLDLHAVLEDTHATRCNRSGLPLFVLGHSLGGLVSALWMARNPQGDVQRWVRGLVLSSPALALRVPRWQRAALPLLGRILPSLTLANGLNPEWLSHQPEVVAAYRADPLVHHRISMRLAAFMVSGGAEVLARAPHWSLPTLLIYAARDRVVNARGTAQWARHTPANRVQALALPDSHHEVFHDAQAEQAVAALLAWLSENQPIILDKKATLRF